MSTDHMSLLTNRDKKLNKGILLDSCPFCGGRAIQRYDNAIYCEEVTTCGGQIDFGHWCGANDKESKECREAVAEAWNSRND